MNLCNYLYNVLSIWIQKDNKIFLNPAPDKRDIDVGVAHPYSSIFFLKNVKSTKGYIPNRFVLEMPELSSILPPSLQSWTYVMKTIEILRYFPTDMTRPLIIIFPTKW